MKSQEFISESGFTADGLANMSPADFRALIRQGRWTTFWRVGDIIPCRGYAVANLAVVPKDYAFEFLLFCQRNPQPCPVIDVTEPGDPHPKLMAPEADLRTDLPRYRVFQDGKLVDEPIDVIKYWRDDLIAFLIGCSGNLEWLLKAANIQYRFVGVYISNIQCVPAGRFHGPMVVTTRFFKTSHDAIRAIQISSRFPLAHGAPVHIGDPVAIGIKDVCQSDFVFGRSIFPEQPDEIALHWGCGITPQEVALESKIPFMITHKGSHMFVTDRVAEELTVL